jgi:hypothetical protein
MNYLSSVITKDYLYASIKCTIVKGIIELIGKLIKMESRNLLIKTACFISLVHLIDLKLALHLINETNKRNSVYKVKKG